METHEDPAPVNRGRKLTPYRFDIGRLVTLLLGRGMP